MKAIFLPLLACLSALAQTAAPPAAASTIPDLPDETVIATFADGAKMTMGEFKKIYAVLPPDNQQLVLRDRKTFLESWAFMRSLAQQAEKDKLDEESPTHESLDYYRMLIMSQAKIQDVMTRSSAEPAEVVKFYDANKDRYKQVNLKAIYIAFSVSTQPGSKSLTEDQARAKAEKLLAQAKRRGRLRQAGAGRVGRRDIPGQKRRFRHPAAPTTPFRMRSRLRCSRLSRER